MVFFPYSLHITMSVFFSAWFLLQGPFLLHLRFLCASHMQSAVIAGWVPTLYLQFFLFIWAVSLQSILHLPCDNAILNTHRETCCLSVCLSAGLLIPGEGRKALGWCCGTRGGVGIRDEPLSLLLSFWRCQQLFVT